MKKKKEIPVPEVQAETYEVWQSCVNMPLVLWERFLFLKDMNALAISGKPPAAVLIEMGNNLFSEYCELMQDPGVTSMLKTRMRVYELSLKYSHCMKLVEVLSKIGDPETIDNLKGWGFNYAFPLEDQGAFFDDLDKVKAILNGDLLQLEELQAELDLMKEESGESEEKGKSFFDHTLGMISKYRKYHIPKGGMLVGEFCALLVQFRQDVRNEQNKNND